MVTNLRVEEWHSVHQRLKSIAQRRAALDAEEARALRDAERVQLWRRFGYVHMGEYLERELGYAPHTGAERLRVARDLAELPQIEAALGEGTLAYSAVKELTRVATRATEAEWIETARGKCLRQLERLVAGRKRGDRPEDPTTPELINRVVRLELSPEVFALFRQAQSTLADEHGARLDDNAFVQTLCRRALEGNRAADHERPVHQIALTLCTSCKRGWQNGAGREIEVGPDVIEQAQCDAEHIGSLDTAQPARVTATVTPRLRRQVLARDRHCCTVPGCRSARNLDLHHVEYQRHGGSHEMTNVTTVCSGHHQQLHAGALTIRGHAPDSLEFAWRDSPAPSPRAATAPAPSHVGPAATEDLPTTSPAPPERSHVGPATTGNLPARSPAASARSHVGPAVAEPLAESAVAATQSHVGPAIRPSTSTASVPPVDSNITAREARDALTTAGYSPREARLAVERAQSHVGLEVPLEQLLREALRCCAPGS